MPEYAFIDIHLHTYRTAAIGLQAQGGSPRSGYGGSIEELLPYMAQHGMEQGAMMNFTPVADMLAAARASLPPDLSPGQRLEMEEGIRRNMVERVVRRNEWTCDVARQHPQLHAFIGVDPVMQEEEMAAAVQQAADQGARGIKLHPVVQRYAINDRGLWPAFRVAQERGLAILTHTGPFRGEDVAGRYSHPRYIVDVLRDFPGLRIILAHCGGRGFHKDAVQLVREFPQLYFDCCGIVPGDPEPGDLSDDEVVALFRELGVERVAFGSDWAFRDAIADVQRIAGLPLTAEEKRLVLSENARRILAH